MLQNFSHREIPKDMKYAIYGRYFLTLMMTLQIVHLLLVFSVTPFKLDQNKNQNHSTDKV